MERVWKKNIAELLPEEITHDMLFDLWFKDYSSNWFKITAYNHKKKYYLGGCWFVKDDLLKMKYSTIPEC